MNEETGSLPENIGMVVWSTPTMRTMGEDIAQVLYLMGMRPLWNRVSSRVEGLEPIPAAELKFPRIDVTLRISGLFRDTFPNLVELIDTAVQMVALLRHPGATEEALVAAISARLSEPDAKLLAANRHVVFNDPPTVAAVAALLQLRDQFVWGVLPQSCLPDVLSTYAAQVAVAVAGRPQQAPQYRQALADTRLSLAPDVVLE